MADARLIIHHHRDDARWARRLRRVGKAYVDLTITIGDSPDPTEGGTAPKHIHICSPAYATSPRTLDWGEHFALIVAGEPGASAFEGAEDEECLPPPLRAAHRFEARADRRADGASPEVIACEAIAAAAGVGVADIRKPIRRRRMLRAAYVLLALLIGVGMLFAGAALQDQREISRRADAADAALTAAVVALDKGRDGAAYEALVRGLGSGAPQTDRGVVLLARAMQETRLLADLPAPSPNITDLSFLRDGVIAATSENGGAWLVDPGTGSAVEVSAPSPGVVARLSPAGDRLWTARPGTATEDETGAPFVPLTFVDIDLAEGEVASETIIRAPVGRLSEGAISPDGALFAADTGPGAGSETLVAVFRRGTQALAGVLRLPSDSAAIEFVGPDRVLATINPPSGFGESPGLYLWRVGAAAPMLLWREGQAPVCPADAGKPGARLANAAAIRDAQVAGELATPKVLTAPSGREIALLLPRLERGACLLRWAAPSGEALETIRVPGHATDAEVLAEGGPYVIRRRGRPATVLRPGAPATTLTPCRAGVVLPLSPPGGRAEAFLCGDGDDGVEISPDGAVWRRWMHDGGVVAAAPGPEGIIATTGGDGRIRLWDGAPRVIPAQSDLRNAASFHIVAATDGGARVVALYPNGLLWSFSGQDAEGGTVIRTGLTSPQLRSYAPDRVVVLGERDGQRLWRSVNVATGEQGEAIAQDDAAAFLPRGPIIAAGRWVKRMFASDDGAPRVMFYAVEGERALIDLDVVNGATAKAERSGDDTVLVGLSGRGAAQELRFEGRGAAIRLSPDGNIALLRIEAAAPPHDDEFHVLDVVSGRSIRVFGGPPVSGWFGFSASGHSFAIRPLDQTADIPIFDAEYGRKIGAAPGGTAVPVWSPSGELLVTGGVGRVTLTEAGSAETGQRCAWNSKPSRYFAFTPDASAVIAAARTGGVSVLDAGTCAIRLHVPDLRVRAAPLAPTSDVIWVPTEAGASLIRLDTGGPDAAANTIRRRARAVAATR